MLAIVIRIKAQITIAYKALHNPRSQFCGLGEATDAPPLHTSSITLSSTQQPSSLPPQDFCMCCFLCLEGSFPPSTSTQPAFSLGLNLLVMSSRKLSLILPSLKCNLFVFS